jgi:hypothetical protein
MGLRFGRWFAPFPLALLAIALVGAPTSSAWAARHKKPSKSWPSKKRPSHKPNKHAPTSDVDDSAAAAQKGGGDDDEADDDKPEAKAKPASKPASKPKVKMDEDEDGDAKEASKSNDGQEGDGDGDDESETVVRKKAKHAAEPAGEGGGAVAFVLDVGSRGVRRTFDFNDPRFYGGTVWPGAYRLKAAPVPFIHLGLYPLAFAGPGALANVGIVGRYERMVGVSTKSGGATTGQELDVGLRGRLPLGGGEVGLSATYGQHKFLLQSADLPPSSPNVTVPNVTYTFVRADLDGAVFLGLVTLGGHVGTRFVPKTGALGTWFGTTKTTTIEAGLSAAFRLTPIIEVVAGADYLRYAFAFNPPQDNGIIAGGAVDQYISGYLALRVAITGG